MRNKQFHIKNDSINIIYDPFLGLIENLFTNKTYSIRTKQSFNFFDYTQSKKNTDDFFKPVCLTLYLNHKCNLLCRYCYIPEKKSIPDINIDLKAVNAFTEIVVSNCLKKKKPFTLVFHGGNEPLLNIELLSECINSCKKICQENNLEINVCCTTNGILSEESARWAGETLDEITLSWDGPDDIHNLNRSFPDGSITSHIVRRSAEIFKLSQKLKNFKIRVTITKNSVNRILEIIRFFYDENINHIKLYPIYLDKDRKNNDQLIPDPVEFVKNFLIAKNWAKEHQIRVEYTGSRIAEHHDRFCSILQDNLTITPDGYATVCFLATHNFENINRHLMFGKYDPQDSKIIFDKDKLLKYYTNIFTTKEQCKDCFNYYHCSKTCPDVCILNESSSKNIDFDCRIQKWLALVDLFESSDSTIPDKTSDDIELFFNRTEIIPIDKTEDEDIYRIKTDVFVIPYKDDISILYAPLIRFACKANQDLINFLASLQDLNLQNITSEEKKVLDYLKSKNLFESSKTLESSTREKEYLLPDKLTLFPTNQCNSGCIFCYAAIVIEKPMVMDWSVATSAIDHFINLLTKENRKRFILEFHGGGEPLYAWSLVQKTVLYTEDQCKKNNLDLKVVAGTNGVLSEKQLSWVIEHFNLLNISFDGLQQIQDIQRPLKAGSSSFKIVNKALKFLDEHNFTYEIRCTVTVYNQNILDDTIDFIIKNYKTKTVILEPVYICSRYLNHNVSLKIDLQKFAENFINLQSKYRECGINLQYSGITIQKISSNFCYVGKDNFAVTPDGYLTNCWEVTSNEHPLASTFIFGQILKNGKIKMDKQKLEFLRTLNVNNYEECQDCFAKWHCSGGCITKLGHYNFLGKRNQELCEVTRKLIKNQILHLLECENYYQREIQV
jgi:uncharacterized protein